MRFSLCSTCKKKMRIEDIIFDLPRLGLEGIEIWDGHIQEFKEWNQEEPEAIRKLFESQKIKCVTVAPSLNFTDESIAEENIKHALVCVDYAKQLDCNIVRTFLGKKPSSQLTDKEWSLCIDSLKKLMETAEKNNVYFALETHNNTPADTAESILRVIDSVGSPFLKVLFDGFNFRIDGIDPMEAYRQLEPHVIHHHMKNWLWEDKTCVALNKGDVDFEPLIKDLKQKNYDGFASFEWFCSNQDDLIKESIEWIKSV